MDKKKIIVCGTKFGHTYLSALKDQNERVSLVGILANGSNRSIAYAKELGIPLYTEVSQLPSDIDAACVVIKSGMFGGSGTKISVELMRRGIHVLQEHPVHDTEIKRCAKVAQENGVIYHVNSHFCHVGAIQHFTSLAREAFAKNPPLFIEITTSLLYSAIDILGHIIDLDDAKFSPAFAPNESMDNRLGELGFPYQAVRGVIGNTAVIIHQQSFEDAKDTDNNFLILHRMTAGNLEGNLMLASTHGPIISSQGYYIPLYEKGTESKPLADLCHVADGYDDPSVVTIGSDSAPSWKTIVTDIWPCAIRCAVDEFITDIESGSLNKYQDTKYKILVSKTWYEALKNIGLPRQIQNFSDREIARHLVSTKKGNKDEK